MEGCLWLYMEKGSLVCRTRLFNEHVEYVLSVSLSLCRDHWSYLFCTHIVLRISLVLPVFLLHPTAKICRDFSTSSPSLISRKLRWSFTKLYIFYKLKNVQSIVDRRNWTRLNYFQTTWPWWRRHRHRSWASRIVHICVLRNVLLFITVC